MGKSPFDFRSTESRHRLLIIDDLVAGYNATHLNARIAVEFKVENMEALCCL